MKKFVQGAIKARIGQQENLVGTMKRKKLAWFRHITRHKSLTKVVLQGTLMGSRKQAKYWVDNPKEYTRLDSPTLTRWAEDRPAWCSTNTTILKTYCCNTRWNSCLKTKWKNNMLYHSQIKPHHRYHHYGSAATAAISIKYGRVERRNL